MNTFTSIADTIPAAHLKPPVKTHLDPALITGVGCAAGLLLALSACLTLAGRHEAINLAIGGNAALTLFALISMDRPYRRFWRPALFALVGAGLIGVAMSLLPAQPGPDIQLAMVRFGLEGLLIIFQLSAMALVAMGWATAGRSRKRLRSSAICTGLLATLHLAQALHGVLDPGAALLWGHAAGLLFAFWLIRTAFCLLRPRFRA